MSRPVERGHFRNWYWTNRDIKRVHFCLQHSAAFSLLFGRLWVPLLKFGESSVLQSIANQLITWWSIVSRGCRNIDILFTFWRNNWIDWRGERHLKIYIFGWRITLLGWNKKMPDWCNSIDREDGLGNIRWDFRSPCLFIMPGSPCVSLSIYRPLL